MGTCKTKTIQADLGIFTYILAYSEIIQAYGERYVAIFPWCNPGIFRTTWGISRTRSIFGTFSNIYDKAFFAKILNGYNYLCNISSSRSPLYEINIMNFFHTGLIFTPQVFFLRRKVWRPRRAGQGGGREFWYTYSFNVWNFADVPKQCKLYHKCGNPIKWAFSIVRK